LLEACGGLLLWAAAACGWLSLLLSFLLVLSAAAAAVARDGLASNCTGFIGVLPMSAYRQNGAGELVGMCCDGRCAVLGGASLGCTRCGAGVMKDAPSSCRYEDVSVGEPAAASPRLGRAVESSFFRRRGSGLPSTPTPPASSGSGLRELRIGVICVSRSDERGWGDPEGDTLRFRADNGSFAAMSFGPCVM
jgi:hypothetical protein